MPKDNSSPSFWLTLPGILTGIASLITALVALLTCIKSMNNRPLTATSAPAAQVVGVLPAAPSATRVDPKDIASCRDILGTWIWPNGTVVASEGGTLLWTDVNNATVKMSGTWSCEGNRQLNLNWKIGFTDAATLSADGRSLTAENKFGVQYSATKR